jgi:hypothetical protein
LFTGALVHVLATSQATGLTGLAVQGFAAEGLAAAVLVADLGLRTPVIATTARNAEFVVAALRQGTVAVGQTPGATDLSFLFTVQALVAGASRQTLVLKTLLLG